MKLIFDFPIDQGIDPFGRLRKDPTSPRELEPSISLELQEVVYRAIEDEPRKRYANAAEFAHDLRHLDEVKVPLRSRELEKRRALKTRKIFFYGAVALVPIIIFALLLFFARQ